MYSTFPVAVVATPAVLEAAAALAGQDADGYRIGTLKRCDVELSNMLDAPDISEDWKEIIRHLRHQVRIAVADDSRLDQ